jgi:hypothetical protein
MPYLLEVADGEPLVDSLEPPLVADRHFAAPQHGFTALPAGETGPLPLPRPRHQLGPQGVAAAANLTVCAIVTIGPGLPAGLGSKYRNRLARLGDMFHILQ